VRAEHDIDPRRALSDAGPVFLGQAAAHGDLHARPGLLDRQQMAEVAVEPVIGVLADRAGVEYDHVRGFPAGGALITSVFEQASQPLGVVHVHLAPVGAYLISAGGAHVASEGTRTGQHVRNLPAESSGMSGINPGRPANGRRYPL